MFSSPNGMECKPQRDEINGKDRGGLVHTFGKPELKKISVMEKDGKI